MNSRNHPQNKREFVLLVILLGSIIATGPLAIDMYLPSFLAIAQGLIVAEERVQLSITAYFIGMAASQIFYGPIIDRFGKKIPLFCGIAIFIFASLLCSLAANIEELIFYRFLQALGGCACVVIPRAIVRDIFSPKDCARVFSHLMLVMGIAPILAPMLGSLLLKFFGWRSIFVFLAAFGSLCLINSKAFLPHTKPGNKEEKLRGAFKKYWQILRDKSFLLNALSGGLAMAGLFAYITGSPFVYLKIFEISSANYSLVFALNSIFFISAAQLNVFLLKKFSMEKILREALLLGAVIGLALILFCHYQPSIFNITLLCALALASIGMIVPNTSALALANHGKHSGSASALLGSIQFTISTLTSLLINHLHDGSALPLGMVFGSCLIASFLIQKFLK